MLLTVARLDKAFISHSNLKVIHNADVELLLLLLEMMARQKEIFIFLILFLIYKKIRSEFYLSL